MEGTLHTEKMEYRKTRPGTRSSQYMHLIAPRTYPYLFPRYSRQHNTTSSEICFISSYYSHWLLFFLSIQELVEELGIYLLAFDRAGYGESDPNPKRDVKSEALDIEELADQLELGQKFYVLGTSMGGYSVWGCLQYIPHRQT
jgi:pimeloyl-ACP methyl ester carboxylesterase